MPTVRAPRRRVVRPRPRPAPLPAALLPELAVILAGVAWALVRREEGSDEAASGEP